jgi:hypothetical protein
MLGRNKATKTIKLKFNHLLIYEYCRRKTMGWQTSGQNLAISFAAPGPTFQFDVDLEPDPDPSVQSWKAQLYLHATVCHWSWCWSYFGTVSGRLRKKFQKTDKINPNTVVHSERSDPDPFPRGMLRMGSGTPMKTVLPCSWRLSRGRRRGSFLSSPWAWPAKQR